MQENERTPIDDAHDWTHERPFERVIVNRSAREIAREVADLLQYVQNMASAAADVRIYPFDAKAIRRKLDDITSYLPET